MFKVCYYFLKLLSWPLCTTGISLPRFFGKLALSHTKGRDFTVCYIKASETINVSLCVPKAVSGITH